MSAVPPSADSAVLAAPTALEMPQWSPYPGLRPFQPDDSEYFYGRDIEVDQVMVRLRDKRFVAVIGGSGSGKSSLVLAGAIPRLRSFAIKNAGDFWAPVVATPGTNHVEGDSPIRRLARKFCAELADSADAHARLEACVALLRRKNGLGELIERFGGELKTTEGVSLDRLQVNFLFLLDQFEELFHPSNTRAPVAVDCRHLVNRIVEQFKMPHAQVCVALTMRSEHLNDCPRYEELPDAINAASYLVKRLSTDKLREAIEQPVLRYLRKHVAEQRSSRRQARLQGIEAAPAPPVPDAIPIDPKLIDRLLADSTTVLAEQDHADHLPLLQHLLFWIWHEASARCEGKPLVDALTLDDLWLAVGPMPGAQVQPLAVSVNTLEACLENRCEAIFTRHIADQDVWEAAFRSLAFKEPNTGTYTQQRAAMADLRQRLGMADNDALAIQLQPWLRPHGYLHWDVDSRTVKVTHETLIRRWQRFRHWIDEEDRQFHIYLRLLEDCERWKDAQRSESALSRDDTLRRYEDEQLPAILRDSARGSRILRLLGMDREGQRLATVTDDALRFLDLSIENRGERERERAGEEDRKRQSVEQLAQSQRDVEVQRARNAELVARAEAAQEKTRRIRLRQLLLLIAIVLLAPLTLWVTVIAVAEKRLATKERILHRSYALAAETQVGFQPQFKELAGPQGSLRYALIGARFLDEGLALPTAPADWPLTNNYYAERLDALRKTERFSEARNTASLRTILYGAVWTVPGALGAGVPIPDLRCSVARPGPSGPELPAVNAYFFESPGDKRRGLILAVGTADAYAPNAVTSVSVGRVDAGGRCVVEQQLLSTPPQKPPLLPARVGITGDAINVVIAFTGYTQFYTVMWDSPTGADARLRATVSTDLMMDFRDGRLTSRRETFWTDIALGGSIVRLIDVEPSAVSDAAVKGGQPLKPLAADAGAAAVCAEFARTYEIDLHNEAVWQVQAPGLGTGQGRAYCLRVTPIKDSAKATIYIASLYGTGATAAVGATDLPLINQLLLGASAPVEFRLDDRNGWLAFGDGRAWRAVPWSLNALRAMASEVFDPSPSPSAAAAASAAVSFAASPAASAGASAVNAGKRQGCGRPGDDPQFNLPFNLILGDMPCPPDAALHWAPSAAHAASAATARP